MKKMETKSRKETMTQKADALDKGQQYFEAPGGTIIIGEITTVKVLYRYTNKETGKAESMWILPKR